jgi:tRNA-dihydrouridine synthase A
MTAPAHRFSVAPMMDWTDRHCRYFHRLLSRHALLYTEMVTTGALLHGDVPRHLDYDPAEHPLALQLGGSDPAELAAAARLGAQWGYDEINLNCGCPSERVQRGSFGACLMAEPALVATCVSAMREAVDIPVTVKHRIGIDAIDSEDFVATFVGTVAQAGCTTFIVHARNAILKGLTPKENREIPPLRYGVVYRLKQMFPDLTIVLNGGVTTLADVDEHLRYVDGVMVGREAYRNPYAMLTKVDTEVFGDRSSTPMSRGEVAAAMLAYAARVVAGGGRAHQVMRHTHGLYKGLAGARQWRRKMGEETIAS